MSDNNFALICSLLRDPANGWSIGSFGAIGEFMRDPDERVAIEETSDRIELVTGRGAIRVASAPVRPIAWDSLSGDGETWGHTLAFCIERPRTPARVIRVLGPDTQAIREEDRDAILIDCGVGAGAVGMCVRTRDARLIATFSAAERQSLLGLPEVMPEMLRAQPQRVLISPVGRVEVFQAIPAPDGKSPEGPHTHLLPKLIVKDRCHSSNVPIPDGWQAALSMHPQSPWRTMLGERHPFDPATDRAFQPMLDRFALPDDSFVETAWRAAIDAGVAPTEVDWPQTRRGRTKARIVLRRLAAAGDERVKIWRALHDRTAIEEGEEA